VSDGVVSSNFDTGPLGHGITRAYVLELEQRLNRMKRGHEVRAMRIKKDVSGNAPRGYYYNWAFVRGIESRFNLMQSDHELRFSRLLGEILRCKGRISNDLSCNSNDLTDESLSTSRYQDDRATEGVSPLTSDMHAGEPREIHGGHLATNNSTEYLYFANRPPTAIETTSSPKTLNIFIFRMSHSLQSTSALNTVFMTHVATVLDMLLGKSSAASAHRQASLVYVRHATFVRVLYSSTVV
jgi:hypothetical protein